MMSSPTEDLPEIEDTPPAAGPVTNLVTAGVVVAIGAATVAGSVGLGVGEPAAPGPGTWPLLVGAALVVFGAILGLRARHVTGTERFSRKGLLVVAAVVCMAVYVAVIAAVGFEIPTALLAFVWLRFLGRESWRVSVIGALAIAVAFYALFVGALSVTIPHLF